ncbi:unnamed protein product [Calypogeia fissa]
MDGRSESGFSVSSAQHEPASGQIEEWMREQEVLKSRLIVHDDFSWKLPPRTSDSRESSIAGSSLIEEGTRLRYVGGVDLSFSKTDPSVALGALVVLDMDTMKVVYEDFDMVQLTMPYIPGFLAFRESPVLLNLLEKMASSAKTLYPQLLMVDGNGILHPRGFGLASHLGVLADIPTIGVGKNLHHVDGLSDAEVRLEVSRSNLSAGDAVPLTGRSGRVWGVALKSHEGSTKPIFISVGHRISLETATAVVQRCCQYRVPEPVRQADMRSRGRLRLMNHESA